MQKTTIIGHVSLAPEFRSTTKGNVCNFSVAVNETVNGAKTTDYYRVAVWGKSADACNTYLKVGSQVCIEGRENPEAYIAKDGTAKVRRNLSARSVEFLSSPKGEMKSQAESKGAIDDIPGFTKVDEDEAFPW